MYIFRKTLPMVGFLGITFMGGLLSNQQAWAQETRIVKEPCVCFSTRSVRCDDPDDATDCTIPKAPNDQQPTAWHCTEYCKVHRTHSSAESFYGPDAMKNCEKRIKDYCPAEEDTEDSYR